MPAKQKCRDCGKATDAEPCPLCEAVICELCAEREGSFCCDDFEEAD